MSDIIARLRLALAAAEQRATSAEQALAARHGGEPLALLSELDEAREKLAAAEQARDAESARREHVEHLLRQDREESDRALAAALQRAERLRAALEDLIGVARAAMREANRDGAEYDVDAELAPALAVLTPDKKEPTR